LAWPDFWCCILWAMVCSFPDREPAGKGRVPG
jgi:hypothetical protein